MGEFMALALDVALEVRPGGSCLDENGDCVQLRGTRLRFASQPKKGKVAHLTVAYGDGPVLLLKHGITPVRQVKKNKGGTTEVLYVSVYDCMPAFLKDAFVSRLKAIERSGRPLGR